MISPLLEATTKQRQKKCDSEHLSLCDSGLQSAVTTCVLKCP
jgi:hypothetical protein